MLRVNNALCLLTFIRFWLGSEFTETPGMGPDRITRLTNWLISFPKTWIYRSTPEIPSGSVLGRTDTAKAIMKQTGHLTLQSFESYIQITDEEYQVMLAQSDLLK